MKNSEKLKKLIDKLPSIEISKLDTSIAIYATTNHMHISTKNGSFKLKDFDQIRLYFEQTPHGVAINHDGTRSEIAYIILKE